MMNRTPDLRVLLAAVLALCLGTAARGDEASNSLCRLVETITGEVAPQKNNSNKECTGDMVKVCDVAIGGKFVFVCTYYTTTICVFERDPATARLTNRTSFENPSKSKWHWAKLFTKELADGTTMLYWFYKGELAWYRIDPATGNGQELGKTNGLGDALVLTPGKGRFHALGNGGAVLKLDAAGVPRPESRQKLEGTSGVFSPDGRHLYVTAKHTITAYACDAATGALTEQSKVECKDAIADQLMLSLSPDGKYLYAVCYGGKYGDHAWSYCLLARDAATGALTAVQSGEPPKDITPTSGFLFNPDGRSGFFLQGDPKDGEGYRTRPAWFTRDPATGALTFDGRGPNGRTCCMDLDAVSGNFYAGTCGQDPKNSHVFVFKTAAF